MVVEEEEVEIEEENQKEEKKDSYVEIEKVENEEKIED